MRFNLKDIEDISGMRLSKKAILTSKWALSMEVIEELIKDLSQYKEVGTKDFVTMRDEINNALKGYNDAKINLKNWIALQDKITGISIERKLLDATAEINKNYTIKSKVWQTETVETSYHNTLGQTWIGLSGYGYSWQSGSPALSGSIGSTYSLPLLTLAGNQVRA